MRPSNTLPQPTFSIKLKRRLLPIIVGLLLVLELLVPYRGWVVLLVGLGGVWLIATLWARSLASGLGVARETRFSWKQVGDTLLERYTMTNDGWAPAEWLELIDHSTVLGSTVVMGVPGHSSLRRHKQVICSRRGLFTLGPTTLRSGDPFGIYEVELHDPSTASLMVMPPIVQLPGVEVGPGRRTGEGRPLQVLLERTVSSSRVTDYFPGDSLNWIHWPTSARLNSLYVRRFDSTPAADWWIVLDLDNAVQVGQGQDSTEEAAIVLAASLADRALRERHPVGLTADEGKIWLPPRADAAQRWEILLALTLASTSESTLSELLRGLRSSIQDFSSLIIISSSTNGEWVGDLIPLVLRGAVPTVLLLDPISFGGSASLSKTVEALARTGIHHTIIQKEQLEPIGSNAREERLEVTNWEPLT
ncbi:MAG: DUF58 domain-containing protein [Anaerolineales bacterium]